MSWGALAWATESEVGSSAAKFILILLANKADENFSCYPSIRTLMAESNAGRSTVLRALRDLETRGLISRRPQFHDSGARRSTRYYLNHPLAPHLSPGPDAGPPRPDLGPPGLDSRRTPSRSRTGTVSERHPPGVPQRDPLNPSIESPSEPSDAAARILKAVTEAWTLGTREARSLQAAVESALAHGWPAAELTDHLIQNPNPVRDPVRLLARRLNDLPQLHDLHPQPCRGVVNAKTRTLAPSPSLRPTEPKLRSLARGAAHSCTGHIHPEKNPSTYRTVVNYLGK